MSDRDPALQAIRVTDPYLPPRQDYEALLEGVWERAWLTNEAPLSRQLAKALSAHLGVAHLQLVSSGSSALQVALAALELEGSIITTPYSYAATLNAVLWQGCRPIFCDIDPTTACLDPEQVEQAIETDTSAILATHAYGMPCDHARLADIAERHDLKIVYDAAHTFGCTLRDRSLLSYGDASTVSFHATKMFHTGEGGAVVCADASADHRAMLLKGHGIAGDDVLLAGLNARMSELNAALGLCVLEAFETIRAHRRACFTRYRDRLSDLPVRFLEPEGLADFEWNYAYCPVFFESAAQVERVQSTLRTQSIETRRYFRPALNKLGYRLEIKACPVAEDLAERALCLPFGWSLTDDQIERVARAVRAAL